MLILSLENATAKAEGLTARGWGKSPSDARRRRLAILGWVTLALGLSWWALDPAQAAAGLGLAVVGFGLASFALRGLGTRYRAEAWRWQDLVMAGLSAAALVLVFYLMTTTPESLVYYPYPRVTVPPLHPAPAFVVFLNSAPLAFARRD
jgi:hypothetical protein